MFPVVLIGSGYWKGLMDWIKKSMLNGKRISEGDLLCKKRSRNAAAHLLPARPGAATFGDIRMEPTTRRRAAHWRFRPIAAKIT